MYLGESDFSSSDYYEFTSGVDGVPTLALPVSFSPAGCL